MLLQKIPSLAAMVMARQRPRSPRKVYMAMPALWSLPLRLPRIMSFKIRTRIFRVTFLIHRLFKTFQFEGILWVYGPIISEMAKNIPIKKPDPPNTSEKILHKSRSAGDGKWLNHAAA
jgi:hypothetical protein